MPPTSMQLDDGTASSPLKAGFLLQMLPQLAHDPVKLFEVFRGKRLDKQLANKAKMRGGRCPENACAFII